MTEDRTSKTIEVIAANAIFPEDRRIHINMQEGATIEEIVKTALANATPSTPNRTRVMLVSDKGSAYIPREVWHRVRPYAGVTVVIRIVPAGKVLRSVLQIVVAIAAVALGQYWALGLGLTGVAASAAAGLIGAGVSRVGSVRTDALMPPD